MSSARDTAIGVIGALRDAGHTAWLAGGCVRDELLGVHPKDYDVATDATPADVRGLFRRTNEVGAAFGVVLVRQNRHTIEVTTFRREGAYSDSRRPDEVHFADAESDAQRRDFTINALFLDPFAEPGAMERARGVAGRVIDYVGGIDDLDHRVIRAVGDADARLREDHLRALRAVRFAARLGFTIDDDTAGAVRRHAQELRGVSRERIGDEIRSMLTDPTRTAAAHRLESLGLDAPTLDEPPLGPRDAHGPVILGALPQNSSYPLALAGWATDRAASRAALGPAPTNPAILADELALTPTRWRAALCLSNEERDALAGIMSVCVTLARDWASLDVPARKRLASSAPFHDASALLAVLDSDGAERIRGQIDALAADGVGLAPAPLLTGDDLLALGYHPGPDLGGALRNLYDQQLAGALKTRADAEHAARRML